jgi:hypothetical protein
LAPVFRLGSPACASFSIRPFFPFSPVFLPSSTRLSRQLRFPLLPSYSGGNQPAEENNGNPIRCRDTMLSCYRPTSVDYRCGLPVWHRVLRGRWSRQRPGLNCAFGLLLRPPPPQATFFSGHLLLGKCPIRSGNVPSECPIKSIFPHQEPLIRNPSSGTPHQGLLIRDSSRPGSPAHHHLDHSQLRTGSRLPVALKVRALKVRALKVHLAEKSDRRN